MPSELFESLGKTSSASRARGCLSDVQHAGLLHPRLPQGDLLDRWVSPFESSRRTYAPERHVIDMVAKHDVDPGPTRYCSGRKVCEGHEALEPIFCQSLAGPIHPVSVQRATPSADERRGKGTDCRACVVRQHGVGPPGRGVGHASVGQGRPPGPELTNRSVGRAKLLHVFCTATRRSPVSAGVSRTRRRALDSAFALARALFAWYPRPESNRRYRLERPRPVHRVCAGRGRYGALQADDLGTDRAQSDSSLR